ncbi:hypothetical protein RI509_10550 [Levilactobacillus namurensis]|nr:hypothetical protein [Levilactobacillus namurensis]MDT7019618.1 hypothetical protein [Levilactobacillus namurensis]
MSDFLTKKRRVTNQDDIRRFRLKRKLRGTRTPAHSKPVRVTITLEE